MPLKATLKRVRARTAPRTFMGRACKPGYLQLSKPLRELLLPKGRICMRFLIYLLSRQPAVPNFSASSASRFPRKLKTTSSTICDSSFGSLCRELYARFRLSCDLKGRTMCVSHGFRRGFTKDRSALTSVAFFCCL